MAIENLQKSEGIASHKSSLLNSHVSQPGTFFEKDKKPLCWQCVQLVVFKAGHTTYCLLYLPSAPVVLILVLRAICLSLSFVCAVSLRMNFSNLMNFLKSLLMSLMQFQ